ncbi:Flp family type IVb pilin [Dietzia maris]|uniref:Flp family type IVb pilin n=1 Tax=Dietzia TaxID=37914 RepID=UPI0022B5CCF1|nr:Flp family type IVb pilin [Dietzia kunjamensis]MCZ4655858.1 Flp family type IVb pilin [Dietzia kunjamensis]MDJ0422324.1 Flp family type IVb pilin [Dietzia kunjamensis]
MNQVYALMATFQAFLDDRFENRKDRGATAVEYGLMVGLIAVVIIAAVLALGGELNGMFETVVNTLPGGTDIGDGA